MTEHLPECWAKHESDPPAWCICDELRACEARVTTAAVQRVEALRISPHEWDYTPKKSLGEIRHEAWQEAIAAIKGDQ